MQSSSKFRARGPQSWRGLAAALAAGVALLFAGAAPASAAPLAAGTVIRNAATATYVPSGLSQAETISSNEVTASVLPVEALALTQEQAVTRPPASIVTLSHLLSNTGNVASSYTIRLANNAGGCPADTLDLSALRVLRDSNGNGVADPADPVLTLDAAGAIQLQPGESASLLVQGTVPNASSGQACVALSATTALQGVGGVNRDTVNVGTAAALTLVKSASYANPLVPGQSRIDFQVLGTSIGAQDVRPDSTAAPTGTPVLVNGAPTALVLLRDLVPAGTQYIAGTLETTAANAVKLYRMPADAPFSYRTVDDASAVEVAIGIMAPVARNASVAMQFAVKVNADQGGEIRNTAQGHYNDGSAPAVAQSNTVLIGAGQARIGVAKSAAPPRANLGADGQPDGTANVRFHIKVRNYGTSTLYGVQATDLMEGAGGTEFGSYTSAAVPAANQYTIVPGSMTVTTAPPGIAAAVNQSYKGTAGAQNLLASGIVLAPGAQVDIEFEARINFSGRNGSLFNSAKASGALVDGGPPVALDDSVDGDNPDPDGDGNPGNNAAPTPVALQLPALSLSKQVAASRRVAPGVYELDYLLKVTNTGAVVAPNVRVIDNLNCTFDMDQEKGKIASWRILSPPNMKQGKLTPASSFTGRAPCNRTLLESDDPYQLPTDLALSLTDGGRALAPGEAEQIAFTVRVTEKPGAVGTRVEVDNKAWAAAFQKNTVGTSTQAVVAATSAHTAAMLLDPQGTVYNALTRQPVAGAVSPTRGCPAAAAR